MFIQTWFLLLPGKCQDALADQHCFVKPSHTRCFLGYLFIFSCIQVQGTGKCPQQSPRQHRDPPSPTAHLRTALLSLLGLAKQHLHNLYYSYGNSSMLKGKQTLGFSCGQVEHIINLLISCRCAWTLHCLTGLPASRCWKCLAAGMVIPDRHLNIFK